MDTSSFVMSVQTSTLSGLYSLTPVTSQSLSAATSSSQSSVLTQDQTQISGFGQLLSALSSFQNTLQTMELPNSVSQPSATSSNSSVASATATSSALASTYSLNVTSLAQAKSMVSNTAYASADAGVGSGTLTFTVGSTSTAVSVSGTLNSFVDSINTASAGVTASTLQDGSGYHLLVTAASTGTANSFTVTDSGTGLALAQTQAASNAAYTINGASGISATNTGVQLAGGVSANFLTTGTSTITVAQDFTSLETSAQSLESAFNSLQDAVNSLINTGGELENDTITISLVSQLNSLARGNFTNTGSSLTSLSQIGLNFQYADTYGNLGTFTLDSNALQYAFDTDPDGTIALLSSAIQSLDDKAQTYSGAGGTIQKTEYALEKANRIGQYLLSQVQNAFNNNLPSIEDILRAQPSSSRFTAQQILSIQQNAQIASIGNPYSIMASLADSLQSAVGSNISTRA